MKTDAIIIMDGFGYRKEAKGNAVIAAGTPEEVAEVAESQTGRYMKRVLSR